MILFFFLLFFVGCSLLYYMWREAKQNRVIIQEINFPTFPISFGKISLFFISDIHRRDVSETIINEVKGKADIVIIGGDLTEKGVPFTRVKRNLSLLKGVAPTYFVWGNNDYEVDYHELDSLLLSLGIKVLDNTAVSFESVEGEKISLMGVDDLKCGRTNLEHALHDAGEEAVFKILVSHNPEIRKQIHPDQKIDLILSGHTHGGQIRFFNYGMYQKGGIEYFDQTTLLVSNGYGTSSIPLRLGAPPETHLLTIQSNQLQE